MIPADSREIAQIFFRERLKSGHFTILKVDLRASPILTRRTWFTYLRCRPFRAALWNPTQQEQPDDCAKVQKRLQLKTLHDH